MQSDQIRGILERTTTIFVTMFLAWCVKKGWLGESDSAALLPAIVLLPSLVRGWWINRPKALLQSAAAVPGTVVLTTPALSAATPDDKNIVSTTASKDAITKAVAVANAAT